MNTRILFVLSLSIMLAGCVAPVSAGGMGTLANCKTHSSGWVCKGNHQAPTVNINTKNGQLKAKPACVRANPGAMLIFRLTPVGHKAKGTVEIVPKDPNDPKDDWLAGKNDPYQDLIMIPVPDGLVDGDYRYGIKTDTDCVDPRVHVE